MRIGSAMSQSDVQRFYDRVGAWQDTQRFYEDPTVNVLVSHADFEEAHSILEVGCGTGRVAERILRDHAPPDARYCGVDLSSTMVQVARERLSRFDDRVVVEETAVGVRVDEPDASFDCVVATYLLDLLSAQDVRTFFQEARRLLRPAGCLCVAGLTWGEGLITGPVSRLWAGIHAIRPEWVGGCRPMKIRSRLCPERWTVEYHATVPAWGITSEVLIARPA